MGGSDKTTLDDIMTAAFVVAVECVIKPPHLGGIMFEVGWGKKLNVVLISEKEHSGLALTGANRTVQTGDTA